MEVLVTVGSCWCKVKKQLLKEYQAALGTILEDTVTFVIRSFQSFKIDHEMTILYKKQTYEIIQSMPDATSKEFYIYIAKLKK
ncbi:phage head closure protein [Enterococcus gallinarum]|nr:phage head closure protein [Enterococcus gallinarum]